jgi:hypothetical protein
MPLRRGEWRVCGRGQTTSKSSIRRAPFYGLQKINVHLLSIDFSSAKILSVKSFLGV